MIRCAFDYYMPDTIAAAASFMAHHGNGAMVLGGGTMLVPQMSAGKVQPKAVLDLRGLDLASVRHDHDRTVIGAMTSYHTLATSPVIATHVPLLKELAEDVTGGPQILHQGTLGGSACFANPASDIPGCLVAVGATMIAASSRGGRRIPVGDFFEGSFRNALADDEFLTEIVVPDSATARHAYEKFKFCTSSWPIVTAACAIETHASGASVAHVGIGGAWSVPQRISLAADSVPELADIHAAIRDATPDDYWADELAPAAYRRAITPAIVAKAVHRALGHA